MRATSTLRALHVAVALAGCTRDAAVAEVGVPDATTRCCPLDTPSCACVHVGGEPLPDGTCPQSCGNAGPTGWIRATDFGGCAYWIFPRIPCSAQRDAATDDVAG